MENTKEFEIWLANMLKDAKDKLHMTDKILAYVLLREGTKYYLKQIAGEEIGVRATEEHS